MFHVYPKLEGSLIVTTYSWLYRKWTVFIIVSLATSSAHLEDLAYLDEQQRHIPSRTSLRMPRQNSGSRSQQDHRGKHMHTCTFTHIPTTILQAVLQSSSSPILSCSLFHSLSQPEAPSLWGCRSLAWLAVHRQRVALPRNGRSSSQWWPINQSGCGDRRKHGLWENGHYCSSGGTQLSWKPHVANRCRQPDHA